MHNCVKSCWNNRHRMVCDAVPLCSLSLQPNATHKLVDSPKTFTSPQPWAADCTFLSLVLQVGHLKKIVEREQVEYKRCTKRWLLLWGFFFKGKTSRFFFVFCCSRGFHENRQRSNLLFSLRESKRGSYIFPAEPGVNHHRLPWVTMCSVARFTFKWNQMAVHSEMIYSNDDGNKSKVPFHIGPAPARDHCHLWSFQVQSVSYVFAMSRLLPSHFNKLIHQHAA